MEYKEALLFMRVNAKL